MSVTRLHSHTPLSICCLLGHVIFYVYNNTVLEVLWHIYYVNGRGERVYVHVALVVVARVQFAVRRWWSRSFVLIPQLPFAFLAAVLVVYFCERKIFVSYSFSCDVLVYTS